MVEKVFFAIPAKNWSTKPTKIFTGVSNITSIIGQNRQGKRNDIKKMNYNLLILSDLYMVDG